MSDPATSTAPLFQPFRHKGLSLSNRIVMVPMGRNFARGGVVGSAYADYFARRAAAGVALCIGEASAIGHPVASTNIMHADFHGEAPRAGWEAVAGAVQAAGGRFMPQIWDAGLLRGPVGSDQVPNRHLPPVGPSGWAEPLVHTLIANPEPPRLQRDGCADAIRPSETSMMTELR
jgi:2,4-dienoyl-CoA reductase-like NADH-dependent reductase (Old Yellow Enzyme family)